MLQWFPLLELFNASVFSRPNLLCGWVCCVDFEFVLDRIHGTAPFVCGLFSAVSNLRGWLPFACFEFVIDTFLWLRLVLICDWHRLVRGVPLFVVNNCNAAFVFVTLDLVQTITYEKRL